MAELERKELGAAQVEPELHGLPVQGREVDPAFPLHGVPDAVPFEGNTPGRIEARDRLNSAPEDLLPRGSLVDITA